MNNYTRQAQKKARKNAMDESGLVAGGNIVLQSGRLLCRLPGKRIEITAPNRLLVQILNGLDAGLSEAQLVRTLSAAWNPRQLRRLIAHLRSSGVLVEAHRQFDRLWGSINSGSTSFVPLSPRAIERLRRSEFKKHLKVSSGRRRARPSVLNGLMIRRRSSKAFAAESLSVADIVDILWAGYGVVSDSHFDEYRRTVPSGGGIYPCTLHFINLRHANGLAPGIYSVRYGADRAVEFKPVKSRLDDVYRCFADPSDLENAQGAIVVSGSFSLSAAKYGNRGLRYVLLEAGHIAQNLLLAVTQNKLAAAEMGGYFESHLSSLLRLPHRTAPLTTVLIGRPSSRPADRTARLPVAFDWIETHEASSLFAAEAREVGGGAEVSAAWGSDKTASLAHDKAVAELLERKACAEPKRLTRGRFIDVAGALRSDHVVSYLPDQYRRADFPFSRFQEKKIYYWGRGEDFFSGRSVSVLAEHLFFASSLKKVVRGKPCTSTTTSGVAAHVDAGIAIQNAVFELIERDAFMHAWLTRGATPVVRLATLPSEIKQRLAVLKSEGFGVVVKDISRRYAPVAMIVAQNKKHRTTLVTASCAFDVEDAVAHGLSEIELVVQNPGPSRAKFDPTHVSTPEDHLALYTNSPYFRKADFLATPSAVLPFSRFGVHATDSWTGLLARLKQEGRKLFCFDLTDRRKNELFMANRGKTQRLVVVRAIIPGLVPMSFGYGQEPLGMLANGWRNSVFPHPFV
jgi:ribosomal protein S12 methylthiotransferase accessory factor